MKMVKSEKRRPGTAGPPPIKRDRLLAFIEDLQAKGRLVFTANEARKQLGGSPNAFRLASLRLIHKGKLLHPMRGFYVVIPAGYRDGKSVPPDWYIDALMKFLEQPYYVGGLSAAALYGAAHQAPQELQVITTKALRPILAPRTRIQFFTKKELSKTPVQDMKTYTGYFKASTPEATALDLIRYYRRTGHLSNVTTVLMELSERLDGKKLVRAAEADGEIAHAQRLGYLLETFAPGKFGAELRKWLSAQDTKFVPLRPGWSGPVSARDEHWRVLVNDQVEPDL
jgi:predicted transcriptional regulator of viral defense system